MKLQVFHDKLIKSGFSIKDATSNIGYERKKWHGDRTRDVNEITSWLDDEVLEVSIKTAVLPGPLKVTYRKQG